MLQSVNHVICHQVAFLLSKPLPKTANELARSHESERNGKSEHVPAGSHAPLGTNRERESIGEGWPASHPSPGGAIMQQMKVEEIAEAIAKLPPRRH